MIRTLIFAVLALNLFIGGTLALAQEGPGKFDAITYLSRFDMGEVYTNGKFLNPPGAETFFENYMIDKADVIAFTLKLKSKDTIGWSMWLDFAMNRVGQKCVTKVFAQKQGGKNIEKEFDALLLWIDKALSGKLGPELETGKQVKRWKYQATGSFELAAKTTSKQKDGKRYLTIEITQVAD